MLLVTFDTNVWRQIADPLRFPNDPMHEAIRHIHEAIRAGRIEGRLSETVFTLEAIKRVDRRTFFASYRPKIEVEELERPDGTIQLNVKMVPDNNAHPGNNAYLSSHLSDALRIGFRLMRCPRVLGVENPDLKSEWFVTEPDSNIVARQNKFANVCRKIEALGVGRAAIIAIGKKFISSSTHWTQGLAKAPSAEDMEIAAAVAEWADGDTVSAHVGYANHYLCTRDFATAAGIESVFSAKHRTCLEKDYDIQFVTPVELAKYV